MKPRIFDWSGLGERERETILRRPQLERGRISEAVAEIIESVRQDGDEALQAFTERYDGCRPPSLRVDPEDISNAQQRCAPELVAAMNDAADRIRTFHESGVPRSRAVETAPGMRCEVRYHAIETVGLYAPGGTAPLVSTVLMLGIPAQIAGCPRVVLCTPPGANGAIAPELLAAAALCGIEEIFVAGGAQAIAAMAYGTASVPRCARIYGPGNAWVTEAKQQVSTDPDGAAIDLPAGPSEVLVIADDSADAKAVAWDLLSQAEHGPDSQVILLTDDERFAGAVADFLVGFAADLPRADILGASLKASRIIVTPNLETAIEISNRYAPEHLIVNCRDARSLARDARNAGSIFIGPWTPESLGDYCSGTNHVLPTYGWARSQSALSVNDFMRRYTVQEASLEALRTLGPTAEALAAFEGLEAHRMAVQHRLGARSS